MQLPSDPKQLTLAAHSIGALEKSTLECHFEECFFSKGNVDG